MNYIAEEILSVVNGDENSLAHYGVKRRSGRYPWGSGDDPYQRSGDFLSRVESLEKQGLKEKDIAEKIGLSTTDLRMQIRVAKHERKQLEYDKIKSMLDDGMTPTEIGRITGRNESSIRSIRDGNEKAIRTRAMNTADTLEKELKTKKMIDIGAGTENMLGVSADTLKEAAFILETKGYNVYGVGIPQATNFRQQSTATVLTMPDITHKQVYDNMGDIQTVGQYHSDDGGATYTKLEYPASISSKRVDIRYGDQGGANKDGVIEIRRGVADLDLGDSHYAQVRILVDGTHYLKGMAIYSDNMPEGADIVFNTNKKSGTDKMKVLKEIDTKDPDNPFGSNIKAGGQSKYIDKDGNEKLSAINKLKEEGEWDTSTSKTLSSQFLSKQPMQLIKKQLDLTYNDALSEYNDICEINNPTIRRQLLLDFANNCDSQSMHLKAAGLPRQKTQVILPIDELKDTEVYAPNFKNGEKIALIRYPHGSTSEIPILTVNNRNAAGRSVLGNTRDAIGINSKVAEILSGADFDGDSVVAIPTNDKVRIKNQRQFEELKDFDPKIQYSTEGKTGVRLMKKEEKGRQMGEISNLITDMTLKGANNKEIARALRHSMVVIDAVKHKLDYKQSEKDHGIAELKEKWQKRVDEDGVEKYGGASTLISMRKQTTRVPERVGSPQIDRETGKVWYKESGRTYVDKKTGKVKEATTEVTKLSLVDDMYTLSSGTPQENAYANYSNRMKALANQARKEYLATGNLKYSPSANKAYQTEVSSLMAKLNEAAKNAPLERRANAIANSVVKAKKQENPDMSKDEIKKLKNREINNARAQTGAGSKKLKIVISDKEWEAIQAGAISDNKLVQILRYSDKTVLRQKATPRAANQLSDSQINRVKNLAACGYTYAEIAEKMGKSTSTISKYLNS